MEGAAPLRTLGRPTRGRRGEKFSHRVAHNLGAPADGLPVTVQETARPRRGSTSSKRSGAEPELYDFRRPLTLAREHARLLEMAFERFARQWGTQMTARLRVLSNVTLDQLILLPYDEYVSTLPTPTAMVLCTVEQTRQTAVLQLPVGAAMVWIDYLFGGAGRGDDREGRELTEIEFTLVKDLLQHTLGDLGYAFATVTPIDVSVKSVQYNPQFVQAVPAGDAVLVAQFTVRTAEREDTATFMLPADMLLDRGAGLRGGRRSLRGGPPRRARRADRPGEGRPGGSRRRSRSGSPRSPSTPATSSTCRSATSLPLSPPVEPSAGRRRRRGRARPRRRREPRRRGSPAWSSPSRRSTDEHHRRHGRGSPGRAAQAAAVLVPSTVPLTVGARRGSAPRRGRGRDRRLVRRRAQRRGRDHRR